MEPWPPKPPDVTILQIRQVIEAKPFKETASSHIYRLQNVQRAFKTRASPREYQLMQWAGDCSVKSYGKVLSPSPQHGIANFEGIVMDLETPLERIMIKTSNRDFLMRQMISCVRTLHSTYGMVHGDVKPSNMLLCSDGKLRLCDFAESRRIDEEPSKWHGNVTVNYLAPNRSHHWFDNVDPPAPTVSDDLFSLGLSIWEIYTGQVPFVGECEDDIVEMLLEGGTVDVDLVQEPSVRGTVSAYLLQGGATTL